MDEIYTLQEVADKLKVSVQSVTKVVKSGKMRSSLIGRQYRVTETFLNEYLNGIFGDTPIEQTRTVNPTEKVNRRSKKIEPVVQEVSKSPMPEDTLGKMIEQAESTHIVPQDEPPVEQELGTNLFADSLLVTQDATPAGTEPIEIIMRMKADKVKYPAIAEHLNNLGLKTAQGKDWTKLTVENNVRKHKKLING